MLKALELSGFKSFADKTRFEFPPGITVVVGPNGSGKSNIVDALKWVLGEQSAKSLRGKDMSDVIFKGSAGPGSRKPANSASATLVLDNSSGSLLLDAPEISVTRRVFRSGESEYLINGEACRLKDIRNLFRGTGIGTDAYSLIEQGKVERLLQASPKDRRAIFEEAAGISRFKAKKIEAERRLERVQANLLRLADIVEEVGSRYRSIKNQASRAARYRELTSRLQQLRTFVGFKDYRGLATRIESAGAEVARLVAESASHEGEIATAQELSAQLELQLEQQVALSQSIQTEVAAVREEIVQTESRLELEARRRADWAARIAENSLRLVECEQATAGLARQVEEASADARRAEADHATASGSLNDLEGRLGKLVDELDRLRGREQVALARQQEALAEASDCGRQVSLVSARLESCRLEEQRLASAMAALLDEATSARQQIELLDTRRDGLQRQAEASDTALRKARESVDSLEEMIATRQQALADCKSNLAGVEQRARVIGELEKKLEQSASGTQTVLRAAAADPGLLVVGVVADLIQVHVRHAELIDAALGPLGQYIVTRDDTLARRIALGELRVPGRIGIVELDRPPTLGSDPDRDLSQQPGVAGSAYSLIETPVPEHQPFLQALLGGTWLVESLLDALALRQAGHTAARFVSLAGELVEADGTVIAGARSPLQGIVSRRSELRALAGQQEALKSEAAENAATLASLKKELLAGKAQVQRLIGENGALSGQLSECHAARQQFDQRLIVLEATLTATREESLRSSSQLSGFSSDHDGHCTRQEKLDRELASLQAQLAADRERRLVAEQERAALDRQLTDTKVVTARTEQQLGDLIRRQDDLQRQQQEQAESLQRLKAQLESDQFAVAQSGESCESGTARLEELFARREQLAERAELVNQQRTVAESERKLQAQHLGKARAALRELQETLNEHKLRVSHFQLERDQLAARLVEDYGIDVAAMEATETPGQAGDRQKIDAEITELRQKIAAIGSVNMEALAELEALEQRYQHLDGQYQDLVAARDSLLKIIQRINNDSRKLFAETLEAIRLNFQRLFRQTFGGGQADIVLEEGVDVLEAGVEIIATPPGKPKFNNSLLSGGEKALTAVSLLMAIFQYRPSPFCVLDEVDAPFDEANIGRFIDVLKSFLGWTRFVIVTHSKKTMTAATTLYGITMQESGVSKRVSVRFEDVSDDGRISDDAVQRSRPEEDEQRRTA